MKTRFFVMLAIVLPVLAIFGCGEDEEDVIQLLKTDPPDGGEIGNLGTLMMTFDGEPTTVTIESPEGSRAAKITGKTATYTFTTDDSLVPGSNVPIGISWVSKGGSTGSKIVKFTIVAGGNGATKVNIERWKNVTLVSTHERNFDRLALSLDEPFLALTMYDYLSDDSVSVDITVLKVPTLDIVMNMQKVIKREIKSDVFGSKKCKTFLGFPSVALIPNQQVLVADYIPLEKEKTYVIYKILY